MAAFLKPDTYGTDVATNGTSHNDSSTSIRCLVYAFTVNHSTSSTPSSRLST